MKNYINFANKNNSSNIYSHSNLIKDNVKSIILSKDKVGKIQEIIVQLLNKKKMLDDICYKNYIDMTIIKIINESFDTLTFLRENRLFRQSHIYSEILCKNYDADRSYNLNEITA
jgi:hypothetical protein